jgi:hypothetical protein
MKMAGQIRGPHSSTLANAMPAGGHTAVAFEFVSASINPSLAEVK